MGGEGLTHGSPTSVSSTRLILLPGMLPEQDHATPELVADARCVAGRQIVALEATRSILAAPAGVEGTKPDPHVREPFQPPALANVDKLGETQLRELVAKDKVARMAMDVGLHEVMRWTPRLVRYVPVLYFTRLWAVTVG